MTFDLASEYEALGDDLLPHVLPADVYTVEVISAQGAKTSTGKECIKLVLRVLEGPEAGQTVPDMLTWSPDNQTARHIFTQATTILGAEPSWVKANGISSMSQVAERIVGSVVLIKTTVREFNGQDQVNVNYKKTVSTRSAETAAAPVLGYVAPQPTAAPVAATAAPAAPAAAPAAAPTTAPAQTAPAAPVATEGAFAWPTPAGN